MIRPLACYDRIVREPSKDQILKLDLPIRTVSESNQREAWQVKLRRKRSQQAIVALFLNPLGVPEPPLDVFLTRIATHPLDPTDNLPGCMKHVIDGLARWLKIDDRRTDLVAYHVLQEVRSKGHWQKAFTAGGIMRKIAMGHVRLEICRRGEP